MQKEAPIAYRTVRGYGESRLEINKSTFIGYAENVASEAAARTFISRLKDAHKEATHVCSAYVVGRDTCQRADDDGEPTGTAGRPILELLKKQGLSDVVVVVVRYYGGVKLGAGGLIRAYGKAATAAVQAAGQTMKRPYVQTLVSCDYSLLAILEANLARAGYVIAGKQFSARASLVVLRRPDDAAFVGRIADWSGGSAIVRDDGFAYVSENADGP